MSILTEQPEWNFKNISNIIILHYKTVQWHIIPLIQHPYNSLQSPVQIFLWLHLWFHWLWISLMFTVLHMWSLLLLLMYFTHSPAAGSFHSLFLLAPRYPFLSFLMVYQTWPSPTALHKRNSPSHCIAPFTLLIFIHLLKPPALARHDDNHFHELSHNRRSW